MRMSTGSPRMRASLSLAASACVVALVATGAPAASAAPAATQQATTSCWKAVVNDWLQNGTVKGTYPIPCYTQAQQRLSQYPDIKQYSSAIDDIKRAQQEAIYKQSHGGDTTTTGGSSGGSGGPSGGSHNDGGGSTPGGNSGGGLFHRIAKDIGPSNAQSIPLPLLVLGGLGVLLLLTAAATWLTRRFQARRITPAPAYERAGSSVRPEP
jgi:hypothetical protein